MAKLKIIWGNWLIKIKKSNLVRLLKSKSIIKELENHIGELVKEKQALIDRNKSLNLEIRKYDRQQKKAAEFKKEIKKLEDLVNNLEYEKQQVTDELLETQGELFNANLELKKYKIQCEEYEQQINNYRTEGRYLVKKVKAGRTPNTIKTRVSKPMSGNVVAYMRGEHEE